MRVWHDFYQECNALIPHHQEHNKPVDSRQSLPIRVDWGLQEAKQIASKIRETNYWGVCVTFQERSTKRLHCSSIENNKLYQCNSSNTYQQKKTLIYDWVFMIAISRYKSFSIVLRQQRTIDISNPGKHNLF